MKLILHLVMSNFLRWGNLALGVGKFAKSFFRRARDELRLYSDTEITMHCDKLLNLMQLKNLRRVLRRKIILMRVRLLSLERKLLPLIGALMHF